MNSPGTRSRRGGAAVASTTSPGRATGTAPRTGVSGSARGASTNGPGSPKRAGAPRSPPGSPGSAPPSRIGSAQGGIGRGGASWSSDQDIAHTRSTPISRVSSFADCSRKVDSTPSVPETPTSLFHIIQQLAAAENALWNILDGLKTNTTHASFFCREYWGCSCSQAQLSLERLGSNERLKRQVQQAGVLESLSLGVASHLCSGVMQGVSVTIRSRLRNLLYYIHENCLVLLDLVCQRWMLENQNKQETSMVGHCPENLNLDILIRVKRYRRLRRGEHVMALRQHNEMIFNVVRQLCRGAAPKRTPLSSRSSASPGDRSPGGRGGSAGPQQSVLTVVNDILTSRGTPWDRLRPSVVRSKMLHNMCFRPLLNVDGADPDCPWPTEDPHERYGADQFSQESPIIWFEPLPPMLPNLEQVPKLPPCKGNDIYTLVLDLDETLVHYYEHDGMGNYDIRPGMHEFLERMNKLGYELVIFTAATQDYADWVIDQIDPGRLIHYRLYRQHAVPWGPIFIKDMSCLGRDLDRTLIIDNVQENFMLQPNNGIFIYTWYDDPHDTALFALTPLLDELIATRSKVPEILDKYRDQIPTWAGFDQFSQLGGEYSEFDMVPEDSPGQEAPQGAYMGGQDLAPQQQPSQPQMAMTQPGGFAVQQAAQYQTQQQQQVQQQQQQSRPQYQQPSVRGPMDPGQQEWAQQQQQQQQQQHSNPQEQMGVSTPSMTASNRYQPQQQQQQQYMPPQPSTPQAMQQPQHHQQTGYPHPSQQQHGGAMQAQVQRQQQVVQQPQMQARPQVPIQHGQPRPTFGGIAGPCQAPPLSQPHPHLTQQAAYGQCPVAWGRSDFGPLQAPPPSHQAAHRR